MDRRPAGGWKLSQKECGKWRSGHGMLLEDGKGKGRRGERAASGISFREDRGY